MHRFPAALALLVAACAGAGTLVHHVTIDEAYSTQEVGYAGAGGAIRVEIAGNPFAVDDATFAAAIAEAMQGATFGTRVPFTADPALAPRPDYRVRMLFNGPAAASYMSFCAGDPPAVPAARTRELRLLAGFCRGDRALTYLSAVGSAADLSDPAFRAFVRQVTLRLFPPNPPTDTDGCVTPPC